MADTLFDVTAGIVGTDLSSSTGVIHGGGAHTVFCWGVFDGATVKLQFSPDSDEGVWFDDPTGKLAWDAQGVRNFSYSQGVHMRGLIVDSGPSTVISLIVF